MTDRPSGIDGAAEARSGEVAGAAALELELATARERLAFYEGFDRLIQENIARSGDLMREAMAEREAAAREAARARAELDRRLDEQRATLAGLGEELVALQERTGALARRVIAALDDLTEVPVFPTPVVVPADPAPVPSMAADTAVPLAVSVPAELGSASAVAEPAANPPDHADTASDDAASSAPMVFFPPQTPIVPPASSAAAPTPPPASVPEPAVADLTAPVAPEQSRSVAVVVHGVPRAAAALSLQRHLAGLPSVAAVEAREYAGGVLRLQVETRAPLALADLRGWEEGAGLEPVHLLPGVIEVKLPGAAGL